ncbi:potassium transport protein 1 [Alternaria rosae]|uniref:potassium transport protein 1 n=1 Tax=Alternaria rosae TaxID=1187941 RepID=UPI001E8DC6E4|nr:potassium transport protein 1 [Alternaria rosae]KAH6865422.1 potassium transport protein 1 [Alternaria rosae]
MWKPPINFITLHYAYILSFGILALIIIYPYGNLSAIDAYYFGVSASTESGLNPVDVKALTTYQQIFVYITPIVTNLGFINVLVVVVRLRWFKQKLKGIAAAHSRPKSLQLSMSRAQTIDNTADTRKIEEGLTGETTVSEVKPAPTAEESNDQPPAPRITFAPDPRPHVNEKGALYVPGPRERDNGERITSMSDDEDEDEDRIKPVAESSNPLRRLRSETRSMNTRTMSKATSVDRAVSSIFVLGSTASGARRSEDKPARRTPTIDLSSMTREELGGVEYRALQVLLKVTIGYFVGLHTLGVVCLLPWIHNAPAKYQDYLASQGQDKTWWAFYSSQTMVDNLGLTLTPDSMVTFRDATWPMLIMSFLAFAGNTFYPVFLRLLIWTIYKIAPAASSLKESLRFLLDHPRRCYTLLFPSTATWILASILFALNFIDTLLIVVLDLDNPEVNSLPVGPRILAAIFQSASSRHTGTATFNLAAVNPAVQFSLLVMMYISIYPIAISIRMSESYEEKSVGLYAGDENLDEQKGGKTYLISHMRNQLSFDLWYIFLGVFCICIAESDRIMSREDYAFNVFAIFFEVVSAYGNVGLSLGHPSNLTSLSGHFNTFGKVVICFMMLRGRHRGLPYALDRAINLPHDLVTEDGQEEKYRDEDTATSEGGAGRQSESEGRGRKTMKSLTQ